MSEVAWVPLGSLGSLPRWSWNVGQRCGDDETLQLFLEFSVAGDT